LSELKTALRLQPIDNAKAAGWLNRHHPLGSGHSFAFAIGVLFDGRWCGVLTFGSPIANGAAMFIGLKQWQILELRKMHVTDAVPNMGESRILSVAAKIVFRQYSQIEALITYCDQDERAAAYKGAGWQVGEAYTYVREVFADGKWYSVRDANRHGLTKQTTDKRVESRRKYWIARDQPTLAKLLAVIESKSTSKKPKRPLIAGVTSKGRGLAKTKANSASGSTSQQAAAASSAVTRRQSNTSTTQRATP
jgi:hypothetical protein